KISLSAIIERMSLVFDHPFLKIGIVWQNLSRRYPPSRIYHSVPGNISTVFRRRVHRPTYESWAVATAKQPRYLSVRHYPALGNQQHDPVNLFEDCFVALSATIAAPPGVSCGLA